MSALLSAEDTLFLQKVRDTLKQAEKYQTIRHTAFCNLHEQALVNQEIAVPNGIRMMWHGGYEEAERKQLLCCPDYFENITPAITPLLISGREVSRLSHRDFLGAVMGLGLKRETLGDIITGKEAVLFTLPDMAKYILQNLTKIGSAGVSVKEISFSEIIIPERQYETVNRTVASLRLDGVLSAVLNVSRSAASKLVDAEKVTVNYMVVTKSTLLLKEGDVFSVRGYGKMKLSAIGGTSRKNRIFITALRYQ